MPCFAWCTTPFSPPGPRPPKVVGELPFWAKSKNQSPEFAHRMVHPGSKQALLSPCCLLSTPVLYLATLVVVAVVVSSVSTHTLTQVTPSTTHRLVRQSLSRLPHHLTTLRLGRIDLGTRIIGRLLPQRTSDIICAVVLEHANF